MTALATSNPSIGSLFDLQNSASISSTNNFYQNCFTSTKGSIFNLKSVGLFQDVNSTFQGNAALQGGAFNIENSQASFSLTKFINNIGINGGTFSISE